MEKIDKMDEEITNGWRKEPYVAEGISKPIDNGMKYSRRMDALDNANLEVVVDGENLVRKLGWWRIDEESREIRGEVYSFNEEPGRPYEGDRFFVRFHVRRGTKLRIDPKHYEEFLGFAEEMPQTKKSLLNRLTSFERVDDYFHDRHVKPRSW